MFSPFLLWGGRGDNHNLSPELTVLIKNSLNSLENSLMPYMQEFWFASLCAILWKPKRTLLSLLHLARYVHTCFCLVRQPWGPWRMTDNTWGLGLKWQRQTYPRQASRKYCPWSGLGQWLNRRHLAGSCGTDNLSLVIINIPALFGDDRSESFARLAFLCAVLICIYNWPCP
jgi:hypothetical protein